MHIQCTCTCTCVHISLPLPWVRMCLPKAAERKHHKIAHELIRCDCGLELTQVCYLVGVGESGGRDKGWSIGEGVEHWGGAGRTMGLLGIGMRDGVIVMEGQGRVPLYESLLTMMSVHVCTYTCTCSWICIYTRSLTVWRRVSSVHSNGVIWSVQVLLCCIHLRACTCTWTSQCTGLHVLHVWPMCTCRCTCMGIIADTHVFLFIDSHLIHEFNSPTHLSDLPPFITLPSPSLPLPPPASSIITPTYLEVSQLKFHHCSSLVIWNAL